GVVTPPPPEDENKVFEKVEIEASVNAAQWRRHLENQLVRYIEDAANSGMAPGNYTVNVRFLVERDGSIADVKALNDPGYGLAGGAVEVIKRGPKWSPGEQNGKKVRSYHTQPITFQIQEQ
ncbi:MAG: energy transducer TonB, partial [Chitinophagaceae bacterium]